MRRRAWNSGSDLPGTNRIDQTMGSCMVFAHKSGIIGGTRLTFLL
jgi:hypothetical protein